MTHNTFTLKSRFDGLSIASILIGAIIFLVAVYLTQYGYYAHLKNERNIYGAGLVESMWGPAVALIAIGLYRYLTILNKIPSPFFYISMAGLAWFAYCMAYITFMLK